MQRRTHKSVRAFTLIELAIVLAIAGLLFVGLWRLLAGANTQVRDQAAASEQEQLIAAVKAYLASQEGQTVFMGPKGAFAKYNLATPGPGNNSSNAACRADPLMAGNKGFCDFLPLSFTSATTNSYGQQYWIQVVNDGTASAGPPVVAPKTYSFMIMTFGGDTIPDTSGGRIASLIGGDGGFIYTDPTVCGALFACGSFGTWKADPVGDYGFVAPEAPAFGHVASRTYSSPDQTLSDWWLARILTPGELIGTPPPNHNTMQTDLFLGKSSATGASNNFWLGYSNNPADNATGGTIQMQGGRIAGAESANFSVDLRASFSCTATDASNTCTAFSGNYLKAPYNSFVDLRSGCSVDQTATVGNSALWFDPTCVQAMQVSGDATFSGRVNVNSLYATTFVYAPSGCVGASCSDRRLKSNIQPIKNALDDLMKIKPVSYSLNTTGQPGLGVIAQDLEKIYPQLVTKIGTVGDVKDALGVNYNGLVGPLIGAVQQLKQENDQLRQKIQDQDRREDKLEQELRAQHVIQ